VREGTEGDYSGGERVTGWARQALIGGEKALRAVQLLIIEVRTCNSEMVLDSLHSSEQIREQLTVR
jgi:hypothetical protein